LRNQWHFGGEALACDFFHRGEGGNNANHVVELIVYKFICKCQYDLQSWDKEKPPTIFGDFLICTNDYLSFLYSTIQVNLDENHNT